GSDVISVTGAESVTLEGGEGDDVLVAAAGSDVLLGGPGDDVLGGGPGDDSIDAGSGGDYVTCSSGRDFVRAQVLAELDFACERVDYGPPGRVGVLRSRTGGGRFVRIPGQPWARVDRRILPDVLYLVRRYHVRVGAGYEVHGHELHGEHPLGLAVDLYP